MGEPYYPEKHDPKDCNDGQCKLCRTEPEDHDCRGPSCQVCVEWYEANGVDWDELKGEEERIERHE